MYFLKRLGLLLAATAFLLLSGFGWLRFSIEVGVSSPYFVIQDALFGVAGLLGVAACAWKARQLKARREADEAQVPAFTGTRFEAHARVGVQLVAVLFLGLMAVAAGFWFKVEPGLESGAVAALLTVLTVLAGVSARSLHRGGRPALSMDPYGLEHVWFGRIPWQKVHAVDLREVRIKHSRIHTLVLGVENPDRYVTNMPWLVRLMQNKWSLGGAARGKLEIPLNPLSAPAREIHAAALALRLRVDPPLAGHGVQRTTAADAALLAELDVLSKQMDHLTPEQVLERVQALQPRMDALRERRD